MKSILKIGNAQAFWGDSGDAPAKLLEMQPDLDYLTLDYLSEVSLSIMAVQRSKDPSMGYARDFVEVVKSLIPHWQKGSKVKIISNAGGLDPMRCALACAEVLRQNGCPPKCIGILSGDNVLDLIKNNPSNTIYANLESGQLITDILADLCTANAYLGSHGIVEAIHAGADIIITGRIADPSMVVAPCAAHFCWKWTDFDQVAQATVAGHLIECGTQVTGGISDRWMEISDVSGIGFPFIEMHQDGNFIITKPQNTGGMVTLETVKEQLLYEIGDPDAYLSPDITLSMLALSLKSVGKDRVEVTGAKGRPAPDAYKVSATYTDGFKAEGMLTIYGRQAKAKAKKCGEVILERVGKCGYQLERSYTEYLGTGDTVPGVWSNEEAHECLLRIGVADHRKEALECFSRQIAPMVTSGPPGTTGYTTGRPRIRPVFGYWPCLIERAKVNFKVDLIEVKE